MRSLIVSIAVLSLLAVPGCLVPLQTVEVDPSPSPRPSGSKKPGGATASPSLAPSPSASIATSLVGEAKVALSGRVFAPANIIATDGASIIATDGATIIATDGATIIATDGASVISTGGGNYRTVLQAKETRISGARIRLIDGNAQPVMVDGKPVETVSTDQGTYSFTQPLPGQNFAVLVEFKTSNGKTVTLRTIARAGQTADVDAATTLVAVGVAEGKGGGVEGVALDMYATAVETARKNLPATLPDWTDFAAVRAAYLALEARVGLLEKRVAALEEKVGALLGWVYKPLAGSAAGNELGDIRKPDSSYANIFNTPVGIAAHGGYLYVADNGNNRVVRLKDGKAEQWPAQTIVGPRSLAFDTSGNMYVVAVGKKDDPEGLHQIVVVSPSGELKRFAGGVAGYVDGNLATARFNAPQCISIDKAGNLFVSEALNHCIRKITPDGVVSTFAGAPDRAPLKGNVNPGDRVEVKDGPADQASFFMPNGLAFDPAGNLIVADNEVDRIRKITPAGFVTTLAGGTRGPAVDGYETAAKFWGPNQVVVNSNGIIYVTDHANSCVRRVEPDGNVSTVNAAIDNSGNSQNYLVGLAFGPDGTLYISKNNAHVVQALVPAAK